MIHKNPPLRKIPPAKSTWEGMWRDAFISLLLIAATFFIYWQTRQFEFINYDDPQYITNNPVILKGLSWENIVWCFTTPEFFNWHPFTWLSYFLDYEIYGMNAGGFHITNVIFHAINSVLLFLLLKQMTLRSWPSALVAALFAIHPLHVESVAWVAERKDVLSTFFGFIALMAYTKYARSPNITRYLLVVFFFASSLMSKPMLVTLPALLLLLDIWPLRRVEIGSPGQSLFRWRQIRPLILEKLPLLGMSIGSSVITFFVQGEAVKSFERSPLVMRVGNAMISYVMYIAKTIWPSDLSVHYQYPLKLQAGAAIFSGILLAAITAVAAINLRRHPHILIGWLWFLGTLVPVIGLVQVGDQARADRYTYIPLIGLFIALAWSFTPAKPSMRPSLAVLAVICIAALTVAARAQTRVWANSVTLFQHATRATENNVTAFAQLGLAYQARGDMEIARVHLEKAFEISPENPTVHNDLGTLLIDQGQPEKALPHFVEALAKRPDFADAHYNQGLALANLGRWDEAIASYEKAIDSRADFVIAHFNLAVALRQRGRNNEAMAHLQEAVRISPDYADAHYSLGLMLVAKNELDSAAHHFSESLRNNPGHALSLFSLANALVGLGRLEEAMSRYEELLRVQPGHVAGHNNFGAVLARKGQAGLAIEQYEIALGLQPGYTDALHNLGDALAATNALDRAATVFSELLALQPESAIIHNKFGKILTRQGKVDEAITQFSEALRLMPNMTDAQLNLDEALTLRKER